VSSGGWAYNRKHGGGRIAVKGDLRQGSPPDAPHDGAAGAAVTGRRSGVIAISMKGRGT
jgi:hypothetical protein